MKLRRVFSVFSLLLFFWLSSTCHVLGQSQNNTQGTSAILSGRQAYEQNFPQAFAKAYHIDGAALKEMIVQGAYSARVYNGLTDGGDHVIILVPVNSAYKKMNGKNYIQYSGNLCPPNCDLPLTPAIQVDPALGAKYITNFSKSAPQDPVKAFVITRDIINEVGMGKNLRVYNVMIDGRTVALRTVDLNGLDTGEQGYIQQPGSLCPPNCD